MIHQGPQPGSALSFPKCYQWHNQELWNMPKLVYVHLPPSCLQGSVKSNIMKQLTIEIHCYGGPGALKNTEI